MPRAIFVQQHGLAESKSDISDSILFSFACNSQPFTFLSCDRQEEMSQLFNISELKSILSPNLLGFSVFCLFFFFGGWWWWWWFLSNAIDPLCRWHCFLKIIDKMVSNSTEDMFYRVFIFNISSLFLCGRFPLWEHSSEVTKEELPVFSLDTKISMWRN